MSKPSPRERRTAEPPAEQAIAAPVKVLTRAMPAVRKGDAEALHQARVATRRLREALPMLGEGHKARRLSRKVRSLTKAFGTVRELDVALETLDEIEAWGLPTAAVQRLRRAVRQERGDTQPALLASLERCNVEKLGRKALARAKKVGRASAPAGESVAATRARAARRAGRLAAAIASAGGIYAPERLHLVRIAVKKLRYAVELVQAVGGARQQGRLRPLKQVQDLLGRMHDLEVLITRTRALQAASTPSLALSAQLDEVVRRVEGECRRLHGHYMGRRRALLTMCEEITREASTSPRRVA